jgi:hypothetical protein
MQIDFFYFMGCPKKQNSLQVDEILNVFTSLVNGHLEFTYVLSTSYIYISYNVNIFLNTIPLVISKIFLTYFLFIKIFQTLYTTYYKFNIVHHDGLTMIEKGSTLFSCIHV